MIERLNANQSGYRSNPVCADHPCGGSSISQPLRGGPLLDDVQQAQLWQALQGKPADGGLWTGPKVAAWMSELLGRPVSAQRGGSTWVALSLTQSDHSMGKLIYRSRKRGKKLAQQTARVQAEHPEADVEVWTMDEHRLGLKPVLQDVGSRTTDCSGTGVFSGYGCMALFTLSREKRIGGFCPKLISTCSIGYWQTSNILALARTSKSFWRWIKPVGIQVRK